MLRILLRELAYYFHRGKREWGGLADPLSWLSQRKFCRGSVAVSYSGSSTSSQAIRWSGLPTDPDVGRAGLRVSMYFLPILG